MIKFCLLICCVFFFCQFHCVLTSKLYFFHLVESSDKNKKIVEDRRKKNTKWDLFVRWIVKRMCQMFDTRFRDVRYPFSDDLMKYSYSFKLFNKNFSFLFLFFHLNSLLIIVNKKQFSVWMHTDKICIGFIFHMFHS